MAAGAALSQTVPSVPDASVERGALLASLGNDHGAGACASCHAFNGAADPSGGFPRLTGLSGPYIRHALDDFAEGSRKNVLMASISKALSAQERADAGAYYSSVYAPVPPAAPVSRDLLEEGRVLAVVGVNDQQLVACSACHGPFGRSPTPMIPSLGGQYARYITWQLGEFRDGRRSSGAAVMAGFAHALNDRQVEAVSDYFQRAPGPVGPLPKSLPDAAR